jgi:hypothetical protein
MRVIGGRTRATTAESCEVSIGGAADEQRRGRFSGQIRHNTRKSCHLWRVSGFRVGAATGQRLLPTGPSAIQPITAASSLPRPGVGLV